MSISGKEVEMPLHSFFEYLNVHDDVKSVHTHVTLGSSLQSHPYIENVDSSFQAMNDITPGTELFLKTNEKLKEKFDKTDDIIEEIMTLILRSPSQYGQKRQNEKMQGKQ